MAIQMSHNAWRPLQPSRLRPRQSVQEVERAAQADNGGLITPPLFARKPLPLPKDSVMQVDAIDDPELVESKEDQTSRRVASSPRMPSRVSSRYSTIFDLYVRDNTPVNSPELPSPRDVPALPKIDASLGRFDFGLSRISAIPPRVSPQRRHQRLPDAKAGAERPSPPVSRPRLESQSRSQYSLFPTVQQHPPVIIPMAQAITISPTTSGQVRIVASGTPYRPRQDSWAAPSAGGKCSLNTPRSAASIPLRLLQSSPASSWSPEKDRWSDESISSPGAATMSRPRTSSSATPRKESGQYPLSFFEDDDEEGAPLRRKLGWTRASSSSYSYGGDKAKSRKRRVLSALLCCCKGDGD